MEPISVNGASGEFTIAFTGDRLNRIEPHDAGHEMIRQPDE